MQPNQLRIYYAAAGTTNRNSWSALGDRSYESSNNIFPYYEWWKYYRLYRGFNDSLTYDPLDDKGKRQETCIHR